jgi:hypothetical protein
VIDTEQSVDEVLDPLEATCDRRIGHVLDDIDPRPPTVVLASDRSERT